MTSFKSFRPPPEGARLNHQGEPRRVGIEIEFAALTAEAATEVVQDLFGGEVVAIDPHLFEVRGTELGDFRCELDVQYAHESGGAAGDKLLPEEFAEAVRRFIGDVSAVVAPCEIVCPPVALEDLGRIEHLREALRRMGAEGTGDGLLYAFGTQLNPEIASREADYIAAVLKAYLLLSDWLRAEIEVDTTRWLLTFTDPFPQAYAELVLAPGYEPDLDELMDNHLAYNPTRNRELDMLPLFAWLDETRVRAAIDDPRIKARPTFHYRLPNAQLHDPDWTLAQEWNRWSRVEHLAADASRLEDCARAWAENRARLVPAPWAEEVKAWLT